jgi:hypothetical protein
MVNRLTLAFVALAFMVGLLGACASKKLMRDCEHKGSGIYECREL